MVRAEELDGIEQQQIRQYFIRDLLEYSHNLGSTLLNMKHVNNNQNMSKSDLRIYPST